MRRVAVLCLVLLAAGLAGVIYAELQPSGGEASPAIRTARPEPASPAAPAPAAGRAAEFMRTSLARPLFSQSRRPPAASAAASKVADTALPRLTGVLVSPAGRSAIFAGGPPPLVVLEGGRVGNFTVRSIEPGQVTLLGPDGLRAIRPMFDPSKPEAARSARPEPAPRLPILLPPPGGAGPALSPSLAAPEPSKDAMPFEQNPNPSGLDIIRNEAARAKAQAR